jgi:hypothetical protein
MARVQSPYSHGFCVLCDWRSETTWDYGDRRPLEAELEWAAHARLEHPRMADWLGSRRAPAGRN